MSQEIRRTSQDKDLHCQYPELKSVVETILRKESLESWEKDYLEVFIPVLVGFVRWAVEAAIRDGCKRVYFLARDGRLMYKLAENGKRFWHFSGSRDSMPQMYYLEVSRYALRRAEYHLLGEKCLDYICAGGVDVCLRTVFKRAGISEKMANDTAAYLGRMEEMDRPLSWYEMKILAKQLKDAPDFLNEVYSISKEQYQGTICYLEQEGLMDDVDCAVIDTGWVGTIRESLDRLTRYEFCSRRIKSTGKRKSTVSRFRKLRGYYFGLYELPFCSDQTLYQTYYFRPWKDIVRKVYFSNSLLEVVWSAPESQTIGYTAEGIPLYYKKKNPNAVRMEKEIYLLERILADYDADEKISATVCMSLLSQFMGNPTKQQVHDFGNLQFCDDMLDENTQSVAAYFDKVQIRKQHFFFKILERMGLYRRKIPESAWLEGSIVRNGKMVRWNLFHARFMKYLLYIRKYLFYLIGKFVL